MTLVALLILPISVVLVSVVVKRTPEVLPRAAGAPRPRQRPRGGDLRRHQRDPAPSTRRSEIITVFEKENDACCCECAWKSQFLSGLMQPIMQFVGNLGYVAISILGGCSGHQRHASRSATSSPSSPSTSATSPSRSPQIAQVSNMLQSMAAAAERVFRMLDEEEEEQTQTPCDREVVRDGQTVTEPVASRTSRPA